VNKHILYIGNNLTKKTKYNSTIIVLSNLLKKEGYKVFVSSDKSNKIVRLLDMCFTFFRLKNKVDYVIIDVYSTTNFYYALIISQFARLFKKKYITILHGGNLPERLKNTSYLSSLIFKNSYKNIAPSNYLKRAFEAKGYKTDFIPNIVEIENYKFKKRTNLSPKIFWVRAFKEIYNPTLAIEVLHLLKKKYTNAKLCMVGPFVDNSYNECIDLVDKLNLQESIEFTNVLLKEDWHKKSENFDIFINTTNFDNTPVSVMEAMALGMPVVSTNVGGIPFLLNNKVDALLVPKEDAKKMASTIVSLLEASYPNMSINARRKVEQFNWENNKEKWFEILK
jgi:glycosyltransferase involved in cell wall biosynthesis